MIDKFVYLVTFRRGSKYWIGINGIYDDIELLKQKIISVCNETDIKYEMTEYGDRIIFECDGSHMYIHKMKVKSVEEYKMFDCENCISL